MKLKIAVLSCVIAFTSLAATAGNGIGLGLFDLGVKAGVSTQKVIVTNGAKNDIFKLTSDSKAAFQAGAMMRINLPLFHIQPELLYTMNRYKLRANMLHMDGKSTSTVKYNTLEVPVLLGMRFLIVRLQAGPVFNLMNSTSVKQNSHTMNPHSVDLTKPTVSYALGLGVDLFGLNFDVRYNGRFARGDQMVKVGDSPTENYKTKMRGWSFTVGYMF